MVVSHAPRAPTLVTKPSLVEVEPFTNLPKSNYTLAPLEIRHVYRGLVKYWEQPCVEPSLLHLSHRITSGLIPTKYQSHFWRIHRKLFDNYTPNLSAFYRIASNKEVLKSMTHDPQGMLRTETSCGYGFPIRRKQMARKHKTEIYHFLDHFDGSLDVNFTLFLKEEMREIGKDTRSIAVPQIPLWLMFRKHLGWMYDWFTSDYNRHVAYGHSPTESFFSSKLGIFDPEAVTYSIDFKKQDARMNVLFVQWLEQYLFDMAPEEDRWAIHWIMDQSFYNKKVVLPDRKVVTFENGEMSGFPGTIIWNSLYSLWFLMMVKTIMIINGDILVEEQVREFPILVLGDDQIFQHLEINLVKHVAERLGHELYITEGQLFDDVDFLSYKFTRYGAYGIVPYYSNLPKMFASLRYGKGSLEYFQKVASFHSLLTFAPDGSEEAYWRDEMEKWLKHELRHNHNVYSSVSRCFKTVDQWKHERLSFPCIYYQVNEDVDDYASLFFL